MYLKTDDPRFVRDSQSRAVINIDDQGLKNYKLARDEKLKFKQLADEVGSLKDDMQEIKHLLKMLVKQG